MSFTYFRKYYETCRYDWQGSQILFYGIRFKYFIRATKIVFFTEKGCRIP